MTQKKVFKIIKNKIYRCPTAYQIPRQMSYSSGIGGYGMSSASFGQVMSG